MADFVAACRAKDLSPRTIEFYLEGLNSYRAFAGGEDRDLSLADLDLRVARAWLADFVQRGRETATVAGRARALRAFGRWIHAEVYVRTNPLELFQVPKVKDTIVETSSAEQVVDLMHAHVTLLLATSQDSGNERPQHSRGLSVVINDHALHSRRGTLVLRGEPTRRYRR